MNGVSSDGLTTAVQPTARAGATLRVTIARGKFHWREREGEMDGEGERARGREGGREGEREREGEGEREGEREREREREREERERENEIVINNVNSKQRHQCLKALMPHFILALPKNKSMN